MFHLPFYAFFINAYIDVDVDLYVDFVMTLEYFLSMVTKSWAYWKQGEY